MTIDSLVLATVCGGQAQSQEEYPNDRTVPGRMYSGGPLQQLRCWDSKWDKDYVFCVPESTVMMPGGRGNPSYMPKGVLDRQE